MKRVWLVSLCMMSIEINLLWDKCPHFFLLSLNSNNWIMFITACNICNYHRPIYAHTSTVVLAGIIQLSLSATIHCDGRLHWSGMYGCLSALFLGLKKSSRWFDFSVEQLKLPQSIKPMWKLSQIVSYLQYIADPSLLEPLWPLDTCIWSCLSV